MARVPYAEWLPVPGPNDPKIRPIGIILHVDAGDAKSLFHYFLGPSKGIESHFHVRKDGHIEQYRDTGQEADANHKANSFIRGGERLGFISIETQGLAGGTWTKAQLDSIKRLILDLSEIHDIPLRVCPGPFEPGVGYHTMWGAPGPWTPVSKSCPGPKRIDQFYNDIVPWMESMAISRYTEVDKGDSVLKADFDKKVKQGVFSKETKPGQIVVVDRLAAWMNRQESRVIKQMIAAAVAGAAAGNADVIAEIIRRLSNG